MDFENSKTPQEMAQIKKERTISDAELLKGGAEYEIDKQGNEILSATDDQIENARKEMGKDSGRNSIEKKLESMTGEEREFYDYQMNFGNLLEENRVLLREGKISQEQFSNTMKNIQNLTALRNKALKEKIGNKKVSEIFNLSGEQRNANIAEMMKGAKSFDELYKSMRRNYDIKFSNGASENPNYFVDVIEKVRSGQLDIDYVTKAGGLRNKVEELLKSGEKKSVNPEKEEAIVEMENKGKSEDELEDYYKHEFGGKAEEMGERIRQISDELLKDFKSLDIFDIEFRSDAVVRPGEEINSEIEKMKIKGRLVKFFKRFPSKDDFVKERNKGIQQSLKNFPGREKDFKLRDYEWQKKYDEKYEDSRESLLDLLYSDIKEYKDKKIKNIQTGIEGAKDFESLFEVIKKNGGIQGSQEFFKPKILTDLIEKVRKGTKTINAITRSFGLRQKVDELLKLEKIREQFGS